MGTSPVSRDRQNESGPTVSALTWRRSTRSIQHSNCVEAANASGGLIAVRDSKDKAGAVLFFPGSSWQCFLSAIKGGELGGL
jgi:hypothetical protein